MIDLAKLPAADMAAHLGRPTGEIGLAVGDYMNRVNGPLTSAVYEMLHLSSDARVLEIGFGNGKLIRDLLKLAPQVTYAGVDASDTMVMAARTHNQDLIRQSRVDLHLGSVDSLPFPDATFDRAVAVNTIYFWPDQLRGLAEIRRVLRDDGLLVLASMTPETSLQSQSARPEYGFRVPDRDSLLSMHREAGFERIRFEPYQEEVTRPGGERARRDYNIVIAAASGRP